MKHDEPADGRDLARKALERATEGLEPDLAPLLDALPSMLAEARRRQRPDHGVAALVPLAWKALPGLAAATLILVISAAAISMRDPAPETDAPDLDALILPDTAEEDGGDPLLEAILAGDGGNG